MHACICVYIYVSVHMCVHACIHVCAQENSHTVRHLLFAVGLWRPSVDLLDPVCARMFEEDTESE